MNYFHTILKLSIWHEYFNDKKCPVINIHPDSVTQRILANYQWIFKKTSCNEWIFAGDISHALSDLSETATVKISLNATVSDPVFLYYTQSIFPDFQTNNDIQYIKESSFRSFRITFPLTISKPQNGQSISTEISIHYKSIMRYWEYILLSRTQEENSRDLYLSDTEELLTFESAIPVQWNKKKGYSIRTTTPVELKEKYPSEIQLFENKKLGKKLLQRNLPPPTPGQFISNENEILQQLVYF